ncbi:MAG TPA: phosphatase PAP2 family protein [Flavisolibacter sp.]|jgi:membrane-associated phospholipid phosphatase|nr:phosphatase PAP2 family protein [Flavisolibacter sp.]
MLSEPGFEDTVLQSSPAKAIEESSRLITVKSVLLCALLSVAYLLLSRALVGYKTDQVILVGIFNFCFFASRVTRQFIIGFSIFIVYWILFDYMKAFPNYLVNGVHIEDLYNTEKALFGINYNGVQITPNEYFAMHHSTPVDIVTGIFYLCWVPVPLAFAGVLFFKNRVAFFQFSLTFFIVNILGFIGYYLYPAAPPWYVAQYGFDFMPSTPGNTAGLSRFDQLFGISVFEGIYAKSSNVFAAMPSMHAAFMMIVLFFGLKLRMKAWNVVFAIIMTGIWFSAVYSSHHYILDVLAGIGCAIAAIAGLQWWVKQKSGRKFINFLLFHTT